MKISFMTFACPQWELSQIIDAAYSLHYHGVEFRCDARQYHGVEVWTGPEERAQIRKQLDDYNIQPICLATSLQCADEAVIEEAPKRIQLAADIGCPFVRVFCGPIPDMSDKARTMDRCATHLRRLAAQAAQAEVTLLLETHDTLCTARDAAEVVRHVNHRHVALNYDNLHPVRKGESVEETFAHMGILARHCHFHDGLASPDQVVITRFGDGQMPIDEIIQALAQSGYEGYLSGEWFGDTFGDDTRQALSLYHEQVELILERHQLAFDN